MPVVLFGNPDPGDLGGGDPEYIDVGTGAAVPTGIESTFQYKNFTFNDTGLIDKYRILEIDGLDDADVRDLREELPSEHGEEALNALYSGRTIAFNGRIESYNLAKLRDMQLALRTAFAGLQEDKLFFLTGNPATDHYITCRKFSKLQWTDVQTNDYGFYRDFLITVRASDPRFYLNTVRSFTFYGQKIANSSFEGNTTGWALEATGLTSTVFASQSGWATHGTSSLRVTGTKAADTTLQSLIAKTDPPSAITVAESSKYAVSADINVLNLGTAIYSDVQFFNGSNVFQGATTPVQLSNTTGVQKFSYTFTVPTAGTNTRAVVRFYLQSNVASDVMDFYIDNVFFQKIQTIDENTTPGELHLPNQGNINTYPTIAITGLLNNIQFTVFSENGEDETFELESFVSIGAGTTYTIDTKAPSVINQAGVNKIGETTDISTWPVLEPGDNVIKIASNKMTTTSDAGAVTITYQDAYI